MTARRLSDRISGFAPGTENSTLPIAVGLPPKPTAAALDSALVSGNGGAGSGGGRRGGRNGGQTNNGGPPPPPPPDAKEDPRAAAGKRVSYHDMDLVAEVCFLSIFCERGTHASWNYRVMSNYSIRLSKNFQVGRRCRHYRIPPTHLISL